jgi:diguanylate cyclase (GGDEF)-like protein
MARSDLPLLGGLAIALYVGFANEIEKFLDGVYAIDHQRTLALRPALVILVGVFIVHLLRKRQEMRATARAASARIEEMERLIAFGHAISQSLDLNAIRAQLTANLHNLVPNHTLWVASRSLGLAEPPTGRDDVRVPMTVAGTHVGMVGVSNDPPLSHEERGAVMTAAALLGVSIKNAELFREVHENSIRDTLTGCFTRHHAMTVIDGELRRARRTRLPMSLMMLDVDHFKTVNDRYGHLCGDSVLASVGLRLAELLRISDVKCRYGGEEFLIFLPESPLTGAYRVAEAIRRSFEERPFVWEGQLVPVTASFGVTEVTPGERDLDVIIRRADAALYRAKETGRNRVLVEDAASLALSDRR